MIHTQLFAKVFKKGTLFKWVPKLGHISKRPNDNKSLIRRRPIFQNEQNLGPIGPSELLIFYPSFESLTSIFKKYKNLNLCHSHCRATMAVSLTFSLAGAGAGSRLSGEFWKLGFVEPRFSQSHNKLSSSTLSHCNCFWQRSKSLSSRRFSTLVLANEKEAEDSFIEVVSQIFELTFSVKEVTSFEILSSN